MFEIYQFNIALLHTKPKIWRRIQVPHYYNFYQLHRAIQCCMGWRNCHLHQFFIKNPTTGEDVTISATNEIEFDTVLEKEAKISDYFTIGVKGIYEYDFGDGWTHAVLLEKILPAVHGEKYPKCLTGKMACPPEDCGGIPGYYELLETISSRNNRQSTAATEFMEWLELMGYDNFKPDYFNLNSVQFWESVSPTDLEAAANAGLSHNIN